MRYGVLFLTLCLSLLSFAPVTAQTPITIPEPCLVVSQGTFELKGGEYFERNVYGPAPAPFPYGTVFKVWVSGDPQGIIVGMDFWQHEGGDHHKLDHMDALWRVEGVLFPQADRINTISVRSGALLNGDRGNLRYRVEACIPDWVFIDPQFDIDFDGIQNQYDNCLRVPNPDQARTYDDTLGDMCFSDFYSTPNGLRAYVYPDQTVRIHKDCITGRCTRVVYFNPNQLPADPRGYRIDSSTAYNWYVVVYLMGYQGDAKVFQVNVYNDHQGLEDDHLQLLVYPDQSIRWQRDPNRP